MHCYYGITDYNILVMVTNLPWENCPSFVSKEWQAVTWILNTNFHFHKNDLKTFTPYINISYKTRNRK